ncbi:MAG: phytanoyl-CoA dioxygenase family protein [Chitinophagaceae bacterium]
MNSLQYEFQKNGFLVIPDFYTAAECSKLINRAAALARGFDYKGQASVFQTNDQAPTSDDYFLASGDNISFFFEKDAFDDQGQLRHPVENSLNKIGHAMHDLDPVFDAFSRSPRLKKLALDLGLNDYVLIQSMYIFKHAKIGGVVDVHQDASFLYTGGGSCIGFWFALEDATIENGCLWARAGGHHTSLRERFRRNNAGGTYMEKLDTSPIAIDDMQPLEVKQGTCIVLHGLLPHYSQPNTSGKSRQAYAVHTVDSRQDYPKDNWLQRTQFPLRGF